MLVAPFSNPIPQGEHAPASSRHSASCGPASDRPMLYQGDAGLDRDRVPEELMSQRVARIHQCPRRAGQLARPEDRLGRGLSHPQQQATLSSRPLTPKERAGIPVRVKCAGRSGLQMLPRS
jgi:hypothetical protein